MSSDPELDRMLGLAPQEDTSLWETLKGGALNALGYVGETLGKPGRAVRGLLGGQGVDALVNLIPFSDTIGLTDPHNSVTGEDLLEKYGVLGQQDGQSNLFSWRGAAGLGADIITDPLSWLPGGSGVNALTKAGRAAQTIGGHLGQLEELSGALTRGAKLTDPLRRKILRPGPTIGEEADRIGKIFGTNVIEEGGEKVIGDDILLGALQGQKSRLGELAADLTPEQLRLGKTAAERVGRGQQAFLSIGGTHIPGSGLVDQMLGGTGEGYRIPQFTIAQAPGAAQFASDVWGAINPTKVIPSAFEKIGDSLGMNRNPTDAEVQKLIRSTQKEVVAAKQIANQLINEIENAKNVGDLDTAERKLRELTGLNVGREASPMAALGEAPKLTGPTKKDAKQIANQLIDEIENAKNVGDLSTAEQKLRELTGLNVGRKASPMFEGVGGGGRAAAPPAKRVRPAVAQNVNRTINAAIEAGADPGPLAGFTNALREAYDEIGAFEHSAIGLPLRKNYLTHTAYPEAIRALKRPEARQRLAAEMKAAGLDVGKNNELLNEVLNTNILESFLSEVTHESTKARKYGGGVEQINKAAKRAGIGARGLFHENPIVGLRVREMRHLKVQGLAVYQEGLVATGLAQPGFAGAKTAPIPGNLYVSRVVGADGAHAYAATGIDPAKAVFASPEDAKSAAMGASSFADPSVSSKLIAAYDWMTAKLKAGVTKYFPAFHTRNRFSNRIQSLYEDVPILGQHYRLGQKFVNGQDLEFVAGDGRRINAAALAEEVSDHGVVREGLFENLVANEAGSAVYAAKRRWASIMGGLETAAAAPASLVGAISAGSPRSILKASGSALESSDRVGHYIFKRMQGLSPEQAAESVDKALFNYSREAYTPFENQVMQRAALFYSYNRNIIPYMVEKAVTQTAKVVPWVHLAGQSSEEDWLPDWVRRQPNAMWGANELGMPEIVAGFGTPLEAAAKPFQGAFAGKTARAAAQGGVGSVLAELNPLLKAPIELATGKDLFFNQDITSLNKLPQWSTMMSDDLKQAMGVRDIKNDNGQVMYSTANPWALWALRQTPFSRASQTLGKSVDERRSWAGGSPAVDLLTGARVVSMDPLREQHTRNLEKQVAKIRELQDEGRVQEVKNAFRVIDKEDEEAIDELGALKNLEKARLITGVMR